MTLGKTSNESLSGVLLVGHGTRDKSGTDEFFQLKEQLTEVIGSLPVEAALLEFQEPSIPKGWAMLVEQGVRHIHVAPLLLFAAGHAKQDIPAAIKACQAETPSVTFDQCDPLSRHAKIIELLLLRIRALASRVHSVANRTALVMVGRGSYDPCATSDMRILSQLIQHRTHFGCVTTAFYAMASPKLPEVLDNLALSGRFDSILIQPHLLFSGRLYQAIEKQVSAAAQSHPNIQWNLGEYLGPHRRVAEAIAARISYSNGT